MKKIFAVIIISMITALFCACSVEPIILESTPVPAGTETTPATPKTEKSEMPNTDEKERKRAYYEYAKNCLKEIPVPDELQELGIPITKFTGSDIMYFMADLTGDGKDELIVNCAEGTLIKVYSYSLENVIFAGSVMGGGVGASSAWMTKYKGKYYIEESSSSSSEVFFTKMYRFRDDIENPDVVHYAKIENSWQERENWIYIVDGKKVSEKEFNKYYELESEEDIDFYPLEILRQKCGC